MFDYTLLEQYFIEGSNEEDLTEFILLSSIIFVIGSFVIIIYAVLA